MENARSVPNTQELIKITQKIVFLTNAKKEKLYIRPVLNKENATDAILTREESMSIKNVEMNVN